MIEVGVVGLGVGEQHARAFAASPGCRVRWLCDLDLARAERLAAELGVERTSRDASDLIQDPATTVVSIASYDDAHAAQVTAALGAGKHVFVEKPLCASVDELEAIRRAWEAGGRPQLASNLVLRAAPLYVRLKDSVARGELGRVYAFDGEYLYGRLEKITHGWRKDVPGYSVMLGGGIHVVDLMLHVLGERPSSVVAAGNRISTEGTAFRYADFVTATYTFPSGLIGRITANFACVHRHQHVVRVFGTRGTFLHDDRGARLHASRDPAVPATALEEAAQPSSKGALIPAFVRAIEHGADARPALEHELAVVEACLAADRSLAEGGRAVLVRDLA